MDTSAIAGLPDMMEVEERASGEFRVRTKELGMDDFLKLLVAELQLPRDPMSPMDDKSSIAEMATFSTLASAKDQLKVLQAMSDKMDLMVGQSNCCKSEVSKVEGPEQPKVELTA